MDKGGLGELATRFMAAMVSLFNLPELLLYRSLVSSVFIAKLYVSVWVGNSLLVTEVFHKLYVPSSLNTSILEQKGWG